MSASARGEAGFSFIEILVSVVLLGTAVIAVLVALQASTTASSVDAQHARAYVWLHDASDSLYELPRQACNVYTGDPANQAQYDDLSNWVPRVGAAGDDSADGTVWGHYSDAVELTPPPQGWAGGTISITEIEFLKPVDPESNTFEWGPECYEGLIPDTADDDTAPDDYRSSPLVSQKVTIEVRSPDGRVMRTLETVKGFD
jgi:hypothetical protein